jgi:hypothetical protein
MTTFKQRLRTELQESINYVLMELDTPTDPFSFNDKTQSYESDAPQEPKVSLPNPPSGIDVQTTFEGEHGQVINVKADTPLTVKEAHDVSNTSPIVTISGNEYNQLVDASSDPKTWDGHWWGNINFGIYVPFTKLGITFLNTGQSIDAARFSELTNSYANHPTNGTVDQNTGDIIIENTDIDIHSVEPIVDDAGNVIESYLYEQNFEGRCTWNSNGYTDVYGSFGHVKIIHHGVMHPSDDGGTVSISLNSGDGWTEWTQIKTDDMNQIKDQSVQIGDTGVYITFQDKNGPNEVGTTLIVSKGDEVGSTVNGYVVSPNGGSQGVLRINLLSALLGITGNTVPAAGPIDDVGTNPSDGGF